MIPKNKLLLLAEWIGVLSLASVFVFASIHKLGDAGAFSKVVIAYQVVPSGLVGWVALFVPWLELTMGLAILIPQSRVGALLMAVGLLILFAAFTGWNLIHGVEIPCGCFSSSGQPASWWSVARNAMLASIGMLAICGHNYSTHDQKK